MAEVDRGGREEDGGDSLEATPQTARAAARAASAECQRGSRARPPARALPAMVKATPEPRFLYSCHLFRPTSHRVLWAAFAPHSTIVQNFEVVKISSPKCCATYSPNTQKGCQGVTAMRPPASSRAPCGTITPNMVWTR